jgi:hypothetical protein
MDFFINGQEARSQRNIQQFKIDNSSNIIDIEKFEDFRDKIIEAISDVVEFDEIIVNEDIAEHGQYVPDVILDSNKRIMQFGIILGISNIYDADAFNFGFEFNQHIKIFFDNYTIKLVEII